MQFHFLISTSTFRDFRIHQTSLTDTGVTEIDGVLGRVNLSVTRLRLPNQRLQERAGDRDFPVLEHERQDAVAQKKCLYTT